MADCDRVEVADSPAVKRKCIVQWGFVVSILPRNLAPRRNGVRRFALVFAVHTVYPVKRGGRPPPAEISVSFRLNSLPEAWQKILPPFREAAEAELLAGESILAWMEPDLDAQLNFAHGLVILTDRRVLSFDPAQGGGSDRKRDSAAAPCRRWPLEAETVLRTREEGGAGTLELLDANGRAAYWRFTPCLAPAAHRLVDRFKVLREGAHAAEEEAGDDAESLCQTCGLPIPPEANLCSACAAAAATRPAQSLLRLAPFARARAGMILLGVALSMASTAAALIPTYLQLPIIDKILGPYLASRENHFALMPWYLLGMAGASLLTWVLGWGRNYVLAWVSERISADLRNTTYAHLQRLSLEFFGGKRTGDLISRVSTDTERINIFLSVHLLDFANDLLMILMTAAIMLKIDLRLALVTLCPLPLIAYFVYRVRTRLRGGFQVGSRAWAEMTSVLADSIPGIRVVKAFAQEQREVERFHRANDRVLQANDRINRIWSFFGPLVQVLNDFGLLVIWVFAAWQIYRRHLAIGSGVITVGVLTVFVQYARSFYGKLEIMSRFVSNVQRAAAASQRVFGILDRQATVPEPVNPVEPGRLKGRIEFRNVAFRYGNRTVVEGIQPHDRAGPDDRTGGSERGGEDDAGEPGLPLLRRGRRRRFSSTAWTSARSRLKSTGGTSAWCCKSRSCSMGQLPRTSPTAARTPARRKLSRPPAPPARTNSSCVCPTPTIRSSASAASFFPAASGSASASPARC